MSGKDTENIIVILSSGKIIGDFYSLPIPIFCTISTETFYSQKKIPYMHMYLL